MADLKIDIERMIMQARYAMQLEAEASSVKGGEMSDMEREQYQKQIKDLLQAVETLLKSNNAMGERVAQVAQLEKIAEDYEDLKVENAKLKGELAMRKRAQYGKGSEKPKESSESKSASDGSKDEDEEKYIETGSKNDVPPTDDDEEEEEEDASSGEPQEQKPRDLSNRPDHYNTMRADICVVHDCDLDKLKEMGLEFRYVTRMAMNSPTSYPNPGKMKNANASLWMSRNMICRALYLIQVLLILCSLTLVLTDSSMRCQADVRCTACSMRRCVCQSKVF